MKRIILAALLLAPLPAWSQEDIVSIIVTSPSDVSSIIQQWVLTPDEMGKFKAWLRYAYPCKPVAPATTCVNDTTDSLIASIRAWETATINGTVDNVNRTGAQKLAADAIAGATPISPNMASKTEGKKK